jgi:hypothetical protein
MSIYRLMREDAPPRATRQDDAAADWDRPLRGPAPEQPTAASIAEELTRYVPSEAVALYTAVLPFLVSPTEPLNSQEYTVRWIVVGVIAVIAELYAIGLYRRERPVGERLAGWPTALGRCSIVLFALAAWVCLVPGSPFGTFSWYTPARGALVGLLVGGVLAAVSYVLEA